jgi:hypothetical protein
MTARVRRIVVGVVVVAVLAVVAAVILSRDVEGEMGRAVRDGNLEDVRALLAEDSQLANAKVMPQGSRTGRMRTSWAGQYVIHTAVRAHGSTATSILEALAGAGADLTAVYLDRTLLHHAAEAGGHATIDWLLDNGADPNARVGCADCPERGQTPLHMVGGVESEEKIARLLAGGAAHDAADAAGRQPLHIVAESGSTAMAWLLCAHGADPGARDLQGRTPFDIARAIDATGRSNSSLHTETTGPGEVSDWLRPGGACATLAAEARAAGAPVPDERRVAVYRAFACGRGNTNDCASTR